VELIEAEVNPFRGINVNMHALPSDPVLFEKRMIASLTAWKKQEMRGIWLTISSEQSHLIPVAVKLGFVFHSAEEGMVRMRLWLCDKEACSMPDGATHTIGAGGFVLNKNTMEVLVVREKYGNRQPHWKLPGGYVARGETIGKAAVREVLEETKVKSEFESIVAFRHIHPMLFGNSDIYFVCLLKPLSYELSADPSEISECRWMKLEEYMTHPLVGSFNKYVAKIVNDLVTNGTAKKNYCRECGDHRILDPPENVSHSVPS